jgi:hypothetical protein
VVARRHLDGVPDRVSATGLVDKRGTTKRAGNCTVEPAIYRREAELVVGNCNQKDSANQRENAGLITGICTDDNATERLKAELVVGYRTDRNRNPGRTPSDQALDILMGKFKRWSGDKMFWRYVRRGRYKPHVRLRCGILLYPCLSLICRICIFRLLSACLY